MNTATVTASFECEYEEHPRHVFQKEGHFVPGMTDQEGFRREWKGDRVHVLVLYRIIKDAVNDTIASKTQVLRVLADSLEEAQRIMGANIRDSFFAWFAAQQDQSRIFETYRLQNESLIEFSTWIGQQGYDLESCPDNLFSKARHAIEVEQRRTAIEVARAEKCHSQIRAMESAQESEAESPWYQKLWNERKKRQ